MNDLESKVMAEKTQHAFDMFNSPEGALVLSHLGKVFGFNAPAFIADQNGTFDPIRAAIRDGQRQVFLHIKSMADKSNEQKTGKTKVRVSRD